MKSVHKFMINCIFLSLPENYLLLYGRFNPLQNIGSYVIVTY